MLVHGFTMMITMDHGGCRCQQSLKTTLEFLDLGFVEGFGFWTGGGLWIVGSGCGFWVVGLMDAFRVVALW